MNPEDSQYIATALAKWLRKPYYNWWLLADLGVALIGFSAAVMTQIWWLLFIPALAFTEACGIYVGAIFCDVLQEKDAEIERLHSALNAVAR